MEARELIKDAKERVQNALHHEESHSSFINGKTILTFLAGAAVGVGIGVYLASDSGKEWREKLSAQFDGLDDKIKDSFGDVEGTIRQAAEKFTGKVKEYAENTNGQAQETAESTQQL